MSVFTRVWSGKKAFEEVTDVCETVQSAYGMGGGNTPLVVEQIPYGLSGYYSNAMKSPNPHSGIYVADTARTLDAMQCGNPACNQGGILIVEQIEDSD